MSPATSELWKAVEAADRLVVARQKKLGNSVRFAPEFADEDKVRLAEAIDAYSAALVAYTTGMYAARGDAQ